MGYGFQTSKSRNRPKPAAINSQDEVNGMKRKTINWPMTSSTTACGASVFPNSSTERPAAQIPRRQKRRNDISIAAWIHATKISGAASSGEYLYERKAFARKA